MASLFVHEEEFLANFFLSTMPNLLFICCYMVSAILCMTLLPTAKISCIAEYNLNQNSFLESSV